MKSYLACPQYPKFSLNLLISPSSPESAAARARQLLTVVLPGPPESLQKPADSGVSSFPLSTVHALAPFHMRASRNLLSSDPRILRQAHARLLISGSSTQTAIFNAILRHYSIGERPEEAISLYKQFQHHFCFNSFTYSFLVKASANLRDKLMGLQFHALVTKVGFGSHVYVQTALLNFLLICGSLVDAHQVFNEMPEKNVVSWNVMITGLIGRHEIEAARILFNQMPIRNIVSWTGMIDGYTRIEDFSEAFSLFQKMVKTGEIVPSEITLLAIFPAVANLGDLRNCKSIHAYANKRALNSSSDIRLSNCLIDAYSKCGCITSASRLFEEISENCRNLVSWTSMISGFAMHGMAKEALENLERMEKICLKPNHVTLLSVLSGFSHSGLVQEGLELFRKMSDEYQLSPSIKHYGCVIDMLGRAGRLEEAERMALKINDNVRNVIVIWRTLLGACSFHGNVGVGERVARKMQEIEKGYGGDYVLMSNILTANGMFGDAEKVRLLMDHRNAFKVPGLSLT